MDDPKEKEFLMTNLLEIHDLSKYYRSVVALDKINLTIDEHTSIGLVGKNGAGKTTLLSVLSGAIRPNSGIVKILGYSPQASTIIGKLNILLQDAHFKQGIPVIAQLEHFARLQGFSKESARDEIATLLDRLNNADYADKKPETMSYGQRKRLAIVQAFIGKPELVLLDEPTAGLDPVAANDVRKFIQSFSNKSAFIISSHNLYEIEDICSRVVILDKAKLIANTEISELAAKDNTLNITLDRIPADNLVTALLQLPEITEFIQNKSNQHKITLYFASIHPDQLQLQVQSLIIDQGFSIVHFSRGKALVDGVIDLVNKGN